MEAERFERVDLFLGRVPHARAAQFERIRQFGHDIAQGRVVERANGLGEKVHEAERALLGHIQRNELAVRLERLFAHVERARQVLHIAGAAVQIDDVVGVLLKLDLLDRAEGDDVDAALLRDRAHVARGLNALDVLAVDHTLEQAAAAADGEHALPRNIADCLFKQAEFALEHVFVFHKPGVVLRRVAVKFGFHRQVILSVLSIFKVPPAVSASLLSCAAGRGKTGRACAFLMNHTTISSLPQRYVCGKYHHLSPAYTAVIEFVSPNRLNRQ